MLARGGGAPRHVASWHAELCRALVGFCGAVAFGFANLLECVADLNLLLLLLGSGDKQESNDLSNWTCIPVRTGRCLGSVHLSSCVYKLNSFGNGFVWLRRGRDHDSGLVFVVVVKWLNMYVAR